jgi:hypothetical protein
MTGDDTFKAVQDDTFKTVQDDTFKGVQDDMLRATQDDTFKPVPASTAPATVILREAKRSRRIHESKCGSCDCAQDDTFKGVQDDMLRATQDDTFKPVPASTAPPLSFCAKRSVVAESMNRSVDPATARRMTRSDSF